MTDHVGVGKVQNDQVEFGDVFQQFVGHFGRAHLGLEIVGRDFWRRNQQSFFPGERFFNATVEKISDVRVFLRLGDAQLRFARRADELAKNIFQLFGREDKRRGISNIVLGERNEMHPRPHFAIEALEVLEQKRLRQLPGAISAEVEK